MEHTWCISSFNKDGRYIILQSFHSIEHLAKDINFLFEMAFKDECTSGEVSTSDTTTTLKFIFKDDSGLKIFCSGFLILKPEKKDTET